MKLNAKILGRCLEGLFLVLIPVLITFSLMNLFFPNVLLDEKILDTLYGFNVSKLSTAQFSLLLVINIISIGFIAYGLWLGAKIARLFSQGDLLTEPSACFFYKLKTISLYWGVFNITQFIGTHKIFMPKMEMGMMVYCVVVHSIIHTFIYIFFAALAAVIAKGAGLQKDQDLTV